MRFSAISLKHLVATLVCGLVLFCGVGSTAYAQNRHERHEWRERHERAERRAVRRDLRTQRYVYTTNPYAYNTNPYWRARAMGERTAYRQRHRVYVIRNGRRMYYFR
jgi:hypothetical protein